MMMMMDSSRVFESKTKERSGDSHVTQFWVIIGGDLDYIIMVGTI